MEINLDIMTKDQLKKFIVKLDQENKKLKAELETATKCSSQEEGKLRNLEKENKKLKEELRHREEGDYYYDYDD